MTFRAMLNGMSPPRTRAWNSAIPSSVSGMTIRGKLNRSAALGGKAGVSQEGTAVTGRGDGGRRAGVGHIECAIRIGEHLATAEPLGKAGLGFLEFEAQAQIAAGSQAAMRDGVRTDDGTLTLEVLDFAPVARAA